MARYQIEFRLGKAGWAPLRKDDGKVWVWYSESRACRDLSKHLNEQDREAIGVRVNKECDPNKAEYQLVVYTGTGKDHTREVYALDLVPLTVTAT